MIDHEREYLSAVLMDVGNLHAYPVPPQDFADRRNQTILGAIHAIVSRGEELHLLAIRVELERAGQLRAAGGDDHLLPIAERIPANPMAVAKRIRDLARLREMSNLATRIKLAASEDDLDGCRTLVAAAAMSPDSSDDHVCMSFRELCTVGMEASVEAQRKNEPTVLRTGMPSFDEGYSASPGHLIVVGARPNVGKTSMVWGWHISMGRRGVPTGVISVDDDGAEYGVRGLGAVSEVNPARLWNERLSHEDFDRCVRGIDRWGAMPIRFKHVKGKSIDGVLGTMQRMVRVHGVRMISIDFFTAIRGRRGKDARERHNETLSELAAMAEILAIPIVLIVQIKRGEGKGSDYREPHLSDFAETGEIEMHAKAAVLLWQTSDEIGAPTHAKNAKAKRTARGARWDLERDPDTGLLVEKLDADGRPMLAPERGASRWSS